MGNSFRLSNLEKLIVHDQKFLFTLTSYFLILAFYTNLDALKSPIIGAVVFVLYFLINGIFLGHAFFNKEDTLFRLVFGALLLIMLLGSVGWIVMIIYDLDVAESALVLFITATLSSLLNARMRDKNAA